MDNMQLDSFCSFLGFGEKEADLLNPYWAELLAETSDGIPFFMSEEFFRKYYTCCEGPLEAFLYLDEILEKVRKEPLLARYAAMLHYGNYVAEPMMNELRSLPMLEKHFGNRACMFQMIVALSSLPLIEEKYKSLGVEDEVFYAFCKGLGSNIRRYMESHDNIPGYGSAIHWFRHHADGRLFRLGRLEFMTELWRTIHPAAYRNKKDGRICLLSQNNWMFDKEGLLVTKKKDAVFTSRLYTDEKSITGTTFDREGYPVTDKMVTLSLAEWECVASPWDLMLDVHIPREEKLNMEECRLSFIRAKEFFRRVFRMEVKAFRCGSWLLNPDLAREMPSSNMAKFQKNVHLGPISRSPGSGLFFVYGTADADPLKLPATTSLHKVFRKFAENNIVLKSGMMTLLAEEAETFGLKE